MSYFTNGWYLIYTRPRQERKITDVLEEIKIPYFFPQIKSVRQWHDRKKVIQMPLFPSYVFVWLNSVSDYYHAKDIRGVCDYVKTGNQPATVKQYVIDNIKLVVSGGENIDVSSGFFKPGQNILITKGALEGLSGEVVKYEGKNKILVRVNLLNRHVLVDFPVDQIEANA